MMENNSQKLQNDNLVSGLAEIELDLGTTGMPRDKSYSKTIGDAARRITELEGIINKIQLVMPVQMETQSEWVDKLIRRLALSNDFSQIVKIDGLFMTSWLAQEYWRSKKSNHELFLMHKNGRTDNLKGKALFNSLFNEHQSWYVTRPIVPADAHDLYTDADENVPNVIKDGNGQVVLSLCKKCGKGEAELIDTKCANVNSNQL